MCTEDHFPGVKRRKSEPYRIFPFRLHNEELNDLYSSPNIVRVIKSRRMRWARHVARMSEETGVYMVLVVKPEGKRPLGRPRRRWVDNIRIDLQDVGVWTGLGWPRIETGGGRL